MKKVLFALIGCFVAICAHAAQIVNVDYIHKLIQQEWDVTVPIRTDNVMAAANMKYLLTAIDVANQILNGEKTTDYGNGEFATTQVADTIATNAAVETLIKQNQIEYKFSVTIDIGKANEDCLVYGGVEQMTSEYGIFLSAAGTFYIDWGDGTTETIKKTDTEDTYHLHDYGTKSGVFTIRIGGKATDYNDYGYIASIGFTNGNSMCAMISNGISSIDGSLGAIFSTLPDGSQPRFSGLFDTCHNLTGTIPENLFDGIYGNLVDNMFSKTFSYCSSLTGPSARINGQYLYEIWPNATEDQVAYTYEYANGLDDYRCIPYVWGGLGEYCESSPDIPAAPENAVYDFYLTTTSDTDMFAMKISAAGEFYIDWGDGKTEWITKSDTTNMTFAHKYASKGGYNIRLGGQATAYNTDTLTAAISFTDTASKIASIDGSLGAIFGTLSSDTNNQPRFYQTFYYASNMVGTIPANLFAGISGAPATYMFFQTFYGCSGLTSIPAGLFAGISGAPASYMFSRTFSDCTGLTSIPENLFGNISGPAQGGMFYNTFYNCRSLTGPSARINGQYLYEIWPNATTYGFDNTYTGATGLEDYRCIPTVWGGLGEDCSAPTAEFTLTTTSTNSFSFSISTAGEFVVDWGDGTIETITKPDTTETIYSHNYSTAGAYTIGLSGQATAYNTNKYTAAISFYYNASRIASIDGSLGAIFGTLSSDTNNQPRFYQTFYNATNMKGSIPSDLFAGISGAPASYMFAETFDGCSSLTSIPAGLFGNLSGAPAIYMFYSTFEECSGLTSIPDGLFAGISGAPASYMFESTFRDCSGLTSIPDGLFAGISGAPASYMFYGTFYGCSGLTSIPENLFGNISGTAQFNMFKETFSNCTSLTGPSARINGQYLYEIWPVSDNFCGTYANATKLDDYSSMPYTLKNGFCGSGGGAD